MSTNSPETTRLSADWDASTITIGDRAWPADMDRYDLLLAPPDGHTFHVRRARVALPEGAALSIVWGTATYSDNYEDRPFVEEPAEVEVALIVGDEMKMTADGDTVVGWVPAAAVADFIDTWPAGLVLDHEARTFRLALGG